ncbi:MAG: hypothetical protein KGM47_18410 [Acidobacteriota bacterium]|nr:hypothetical protein [Acidobacteriota bacterium]
MKYLLHIETRDDLIIVCRLLNILRRKGARVEALLMSLTPEGYSLMALAQFQNADAEHMFHFLRRAEGVLHVTYYHHDTEGAAAFVLVDERAGGAEGPGHAPLAPGAKLVFSGHGKSFWEVPGGTGKHPPGALPFSRVRSTRGEEGSRHTA